MTRESAALAIALAMRDSGKSEEEVAASLTLVTGDAELGRAAAFEAFRDSDHYRFSRTENVVDHASHNYEEWHGYLSSDLPDGWNESDSGICCHDCRVIVGDRPIGFSRP